MPLNHSTKPFTIDKTRAAFVSLKYSFRRVIPITVDRLEACENRDINTREIKKMTTPSELYKNELTELKADLMSVCTEDNRRNGKNEAYNLTPELNKKIYNLYLKYSIKNVFGDRCSWQQKQGSGYDRKILEGYQIHYYGKNADKFYLLKYSEADKERVYEAIEQGILESDKY